jgi:hypothetical protein
MRKGDYSQEKCDEVGAELRDTAAWLSGGHLTAEQFRQALLVLEAEKVKRYGFKLSVEDTSAGRSHIELRSANDNRLCASLDFDSGTQRLKIEHLAG